MLASLPEFACGTSDRSFQFAALPEIILIGSDRSGCSLPDGKARPTMQDVTMLLFTVVFFGLAFLYVKVCQKLR
jgi:hypothetical protein